MYLSETRAVENCIYVPQSRTVNNLIEDVYENLLSRPRSLPPKYFYDETGSLLFDQICNTDEYYPTRVEAGLLEKYACEFIVQANPDHILEFGSGTSRKTHHLIQACEQQKIECEYLPFDVCIEMLQQVHNEFNQQYDWLDVLPLVGDYTAGLKHLHRPDGSCMYVFLGSSIGNFDKGDARRFIEEVRHCMKPGDTLLIGVDRVKDEQVLHAAYNDAQGITEQFNLNVLSVLNEQLDGDFDAGSFRHQAIYNDNDQRIEMYLVAEKEQRVRLHSMNEELNFQKEEKILTEISQKYTHQGIEDLLTGAGLSIMKHTESNNQWFSLVLAGL